MALEHDMLQKYGVRIETIQERFEDSAIGRYILATRAMIAEVERENTYMHTQRGKRDRLANGAMNGHPKPAYGYLFVDTERETKARYEFNYKIIYVDSEGTAWTEVMVVEYIFSLFKQGENIKGIATTLNELDVPPPKKPRKGEAHWQPATVRRILTNRMYMGEVWANKYKRENGKVLKRPKEEQYLLPIGTAPALIDSATFEWVQAQLEINKQDSTRNNKHPQDLGILRAGYCHCGICGRTMHVMHHPTQSNNRRKPEYYCRQNAGKDALVCHHTTSITVHILDALAWEEALKRIKNPQLVRAKVAELREANKPVVNIEDVQATIEHIRKQMNNLYKLAQNATNDETIDNLTVIMKDLEKRKQEAEALIYDIAENDEEREEVEAEIVKFEKWVEKVQPFLADPHYTPSYDEQRLAIRILGIRAIVFPASGDYPFRAQIDTTVPAILSKMKSCITNDPW